MESKRLNKNAEWSKKKCNKCASGINFIYCGKRNIRKKISFTGRVVGGTFWTEIEIRGKI
jgi:hypothetical protein